MSQQQIDFASPARRAPSRGREAAAVPSAARHASHGWLLIMTRLLLISHKQGSGMSQVLPDVVVMKGWVVGWFSCFPCRWASWDRTFSLSLLSC